MEQERFTNKDKLIEMLDFEHGTTGAVGLAIKTSGNGISEAKGYDNIPVNRKRAQLFIDFETYDDLIAWLCAEYKEGKQ